MDDESEYDKPADGRRSYGSNPEFKGPKRPFGWYINQEKHEIRTRLLAEGKPADHTDIEREYIQAHANDERYADYQKRVLFPKWERQASNAFNNGETKRQIGFTRPELEWLAEHFEGANDPFAQVVYQRVMELLK